MPWSTPSLTDLRTLNRNNIDAILQTPGVISFDLAMADHPVPDNGHMAVMGAATGA